MDGAMSLEDALMERLRIIDCKPEDLSRFIQTHPPQSRLTEVCDWRCRISICWHAHCMANMTL